MSAIASVEWLAECERLAVSYDAAALALAIAYTRTNPDGFGCFACVLQELAKVAQSCSAAVYEHGKKTSPLQSQCGMRAGALLTSGFAFLEMKGGAR